MKNTAKIRKIGNSLGLTLSRETLGSLALKESDEVEVRIDHGTITLRPVQTQLQQWEQWFKDHPSVNPEGAIMGDDDGILSDDKEWVW